MAKRKSKGKAKGPQVDVPEELAAELEEPARSEASDAEPRADSEVEAGKASPTAPAEELTLEDQLEQARDRYLRLAAEFENFKRRALKERHDLQLYATENLVKELLPTVDNLERALEHARCAEEGGEGEKLQEGIELTYRSVMQTLERCGVRPVEAENAMFDPSVHEAIRRVATNEHPSGTVVEVFQRGYQLRDRLLRPALVAVAAPEEEPS